MSNEFVRSFLKYPGNKYSVLPTLMPIIKGYKPNYLIEPFCGSAVVSINAIRNKVAQKCFANDYNPSLISLMDAVKTDAMGLIEQFKDLKYSDIAGFPDPLTKERYNFIRDEVYNKRDYSRYTRAALFLFLVCSCFNGDIRYNSELKFNSTFGYRNNLSKNCIGDIIKASRHMGGVNFYNFDSVEFLERLHEITGLDNQQIKQAVIYLDPPYTKLDHSNSVVSYTSGTFDDNKRHQMADMCRRFADSGTPCIVSDHDSTVARQCYNKADQIIELVVDRKINTKAIKNAKEIVAIYQPRQ